jgi:hypothetical protein
MHGAPAAARAIRRDVLRLDQPLDLSAKAWLRADWLERGVDLVEGG